MAEISKFFKSINGDRKYTANEFVSYFKALFSTGVLKNTSLAVTQNSPAGLSVLVSTGMAIIEGYQYENTTSKAMTIKAADVTNPRIDRIILRLNVNDGVRSIVLAVLKGTAAGSPVAPTLTTDLTGSGIYEISLAQIAVAAGATTILTANITDERLNETVCGLVEIQAAIDNSKNYEKVTTTYAMDNTDDYVIATSGTFTVTLPQAALSNSKHYTIKNIGSGVVTVAAYGSETVDKNATFTLNQYDSVTVFSDLTEWYIV